jgi:peptidyl-prolyl cis-trans isomerase SurA
MRNPIERAILIALATLSTVKTQAQTLDHSLQTQAQTQGPSQATVFTIDGAPVSRDEFLKAYNKNNTGEKPTDKAYRDYLELYIRYKLKVKAAYAMGLDTLPSQRTELQNFRSQVAESYMKDDVSLDRLVNEVFARGQKDIHLAHIFVALPKNPSTLDTLRGNEKIQAAYTALKKGRKFNEAAMEFSEDPSAKANGGDVGYITVFTLPYELENLAYSLAPGAYSKPYRSKGGYHIFKNLGIRKSLGRMRAAQILLAYPPDANTEARMAVKLRADSVYQLVQQGDNFSDLAKRYSGDNLSYQTGGEIPEFGIGKFDLPFETTVFALDRDGAVSQPIASSYGYHIVKRLARKPFPATATQDGMAYVRQQVMNDPRIEIARKAFLTRIYQQTGFRLGSFSEPELWAFTDSAMLNPPLASYRSLNQGTTLFTFGRQTYPLKGWLDYARNQRAMRNPAGGKAGKQLFDQYVEKSALDFYRNHLEEYNQEFAFQLKEFKEGNLLFEVMQRKIWDKASTDSTGLRNYFESHREKYWWQASAEAILLTCNQQKTADALKSELQANPSNWRTLTDSAGSSVQADSGRYELTQIPGGDNMKFAPGMFTSFSVNKTDHTVSFAYILQVISDRSPRTYKDARGFVINDYQNFLEEEWIADLKKKYPVRIDEKVVASLGKAASF